ncbi:MAG: hypothetical protein NWF00_11265 [Candidatus Bathyarchaeota archaeon]|nr:hypothetical protein [Candidatus Bathyarchaeota archaeon]
MKSITEKYFSILKDYFGEAFKIASSQGFDSRKYTPILNEIYDWKLAEAIMDSMYDELSKLDWDCQLLTIDKVPGLKASYMGKGFSYLRPVTETSDFLRKTALYADTIIVKDDVLTALSGWKNNFLESRFAFSYLTQTVIDNLALEKLFLPNSDQQICALSPSFWWFAKKNNLFDETSNIALESTVLFASHVFGKKFQNIEDLQKFLSSIRSWNEFLRLAVNHRIITNPNGTQMSNEDFRNMQISNQTGFIGSTTFSVYETILRSPNSSITMDLMYMGRLRSVLASNLKGQWNHLSWLIRNQNEEIREKLGKQALSKDELVINALQQKELKWLGNVPIEKIEEIREKGELQELRTLLNQNIKELENSKDEEFLEVGCQVKYNIEQAMKKHAADTKNLNEKYRIKFALGKASIVVSGTLGVLSAAYPPIAVAAGVLSATVGGGSIINTVNDYIDKREEVKELKRKPVAMLFDAKKVAPYS